jgi:site-specific DNA recombinase
MTTATGYVRVSTEQQAGEGISLDDQRTRIKAFCKGRGWDLLNIYADEGRSGGRADNRPGLWEAVESAAGGVLVVYDLFRLSRSVSDACKILNRLQDIKADWVSMTEGNMIDTTTSGGNLMFHVLLAIGQYQRQQTSERCKQVVKWKRGRGERCGKVPYGYRLNPDGKRMEIDRDEQETIRIARELRTKGMSCRKIGRHLEEDGRLPRNGKSWWQTTIRKFVDFDRDFYPTVT